MKKVIKIIIITSIFLLLAFSIVTADLTLSEQKTTRCQATSWNDEGEVLTTECYEESVNLNYISKQELIEWYKIARSKIISQQEEIDNLKVQGQITRNEMCEKTNIQWSWC